MTVAHHEAPPRRSADVDRPEGAVMLRNAGMRVTLSRLAVLDVIRSSDAHLSAEEIRLQMQAGGVSLPRSSVFNIVSALADHGLVHRVELGGPARFERELGAHDHFRCSGCGRIDNVPPAGIEIPRLAGRVESVSVLYRGVCRACAGS